MYPYNKSLKSAYREDFTVLKPHKTDLWEGTEMKTNFFFREKVFLSEIVGKKDRLSNRAEQLSNRAERLSTRAKRG